MKRLTWVLMAIACGILALAVSVTTAQAGTLLTSQVGYTGPFLDLSPYANGSYNFTFGPKPIPGGITFTSNNGGGNSGLGSVLGQGFYGLLSNGSFDQIPVYAGLDSGHGYMTFTFANPVSSFGGFMNYAPSSLYDDPVITALDINGVVLDSFDLAVLAPISTPGGLDAFIFRGISESGDVIKSFRLSGSYLLITGTANGAPIVPEPGTLALLGSGLIGLAGTLRRKLRG